VSRKPKPAELKVATLLELTRSDGTLDKPSLAVIAITAKPPELPPLDETQRRRLLAKYFAGDKLSGREHLYLRDLPERRRQVGRPKIEGPEQRLEIAWCCIRLLAHDSKWKKLDAYVAALFGCSTRKVQAAVKFAREFEDGGWWRAAQQNPQLELWRRLRL
jgi:hypothetical protein